MYRQFVEYQMVDSLEGAHGGGSDCALLDGLRAGIAVAEASLQCRLERRETRGCHNRADFPDLDPTLQVNLFCRQAEGRTLSVWSEPVPPIPHELETGVGEAETPDVAGRLLE